METAKKLAPTRPHPAAPNNQLFHKLVGPWVGRLAAVLTGVGLLWSVLTYRRRRETTEPAGGTVARGSEGQESVR